MSFIQGYSLCGSERLESCQNVPRLNIASRYTTLKQRRFNVTYNIETTSIRRWFNVMNSALNRRCFNAVSTSIQHHDVESTLNRCCFNVVCPEGWLRAEVYTIPKCFVLDSCFCWRSSVHVGIGIQEKSSRQVLIYGTCDVRKGTFTKSDMCTQNRKVWKRNKSKQNPHVPTNASIIMSHFW